VHRRGAEARQPGLIVAPRFVGTDSCLLGEERVPYRLFRSERRTLGITVEPGGELFVTAPEGVESDRIDAVLRRRRQWIRRQRERAFDQPRPAPPRQWVGGETHRYLGRQYRLKIVKGATGVSLQGGYFVVSSPDRTPARIRAAMELWYRNHAASLFQRRAAGLIASTPRLRLKEVPPIRVQRLAKRWGSCTPSGTLVLNVDAVKLPIGCVDYLLMHELCHHRVPHHGRQFWRLLEACMPDWERWRERLGRVEV